MKLNGEGLIQDNFGNAFRMFLIDDLAIKAKFYGDDVIRLTLGKSDLQLQYGIRNTMVTLLNDNEISNLVFPKGIPELRFAIAKHYRNLHGLEIDPEQIFVDSGTSSIFRNLLQMIIERNDEVILPKPYYPLYRISAQLSKAKIKYYPINTKTLKIDIDTLNLQVTNQTKAIIINSPGNPLGNIVSRDMLIKISNSLPEGTFLIFDEIYENTKFNGEPSITQFLLSDSRFKRFNIIITNSFSKAYRMYTKRIGWCILPDLISQNMIELLHHTQLTVDPVVQYGAIEALKYTSEIESLNNVHRKRWIYTKNILSKLELVELFESKGGFYCTIDCNEFLKYKDIDNCYELAVDILNKAKVALVPGQDFGLPGTLRLSFTSNRYEEAIDRIYCYFNS